MASTLGTAIQAAVKETGEIRTLSLACLDALAKEHGLSRRETEIAALELGVLPRRYLRNYGTVGAEGQLALLRSCVAVIGLGGLGGYIVEGLARMGVGRLVLVDGDDYGKLLLYKFPKDKLVYGPLQIEARIDQDSEISQQLTLWSQQGSRVTRGNLLVIPIENSLLYIEPLYIQAETGQLPELKRVLVSDGERVVMEVDLETALKELFGTTVRKNTKTTIEGKSQEELIKEASDYYDAILDAMDKGDWSAFGENFDRLGEILGSLEKEK